MIFLVWLVAYPFLAIYRGVVLTLLWRWFVVPAFGLPELSVIHAVGISILISMLVAQMRPKDDEGTTETVVRGILSSFIGSSLSLLFGFVWSLFA